MTQAMETNIRQPRVSYRNHREAKHSQTRPLGNGREQGALRRVCGRQNKKAVGIAVCIG